MHVQRALGSPSLDGRIQIEGLGRVCEDFVGEEVGDLLCERLAGQVRGTTEGGQRHMLTKGQGGGVSGEGSACSRRVLPMKLCSDRTRRLWQLEMHLDSDTH